MEAHAEIGLGSELPSGLREVIDLGLKAGASDWHLRAEEPCFLRVRGEIVNLDAASVTEGALRTVAEFAQAGGKKDASFAYGGDYYRLHTYSAGGAICVSLRHIPGKIPHLTSLNPPPVFAQSALASSRGLILVTGPTGSGKSTTLAAAIDHRNAQNAEVIVTLEDPIEFRHRNKRGLVRQQEYGRDFGNFPEAVRDVVRADPDVILVGEMRDSETMSAALTAAETGHLVLATLHCATAKDAISRIADAYPQERAAEIRARLAKSLVAVLGQQLVPARTGELVAVFELLIATPAVRNLIADPANRYDLIPNEIATGGSHGMISFDQSLQDLVRRKIVDPAEASKAAVNPAPFKARP